MGQNKIAKGDSIMIPIPAGGCSSGGFVDSSTNGIIATPGLPIQVGNDMVVVPEGTYSAGTVGNVTGHIRGAFGNQLLKTGDAPAVGDKLYLDTVDGYLTVTSGGNLFAGWAYSLPAVVGVNTVIALRLKG